FGELLVYQFATRRRSLLLAALVAAATCVSGPALFAQVATEEAPATTPSAAPGEMKTVAVVGITSYNNLINDANFVGSLAGRPEMGQMLQGTIALFTQGKGLDGVDQTKPWGAIVQTDGAQFLPVACIAVTDVNKVLSIVQGFGAQIKDGEEGVKEIVLPNSQSIHLKEANGWAYIGQNAGALANLPADPAAELNAIVANYDLGARISVQNVPEQYRQMAVEAMKSGMNDGLKKKDDESDEDFETRRKLAEAQIAQLEQMVSEVNEVTTGWAIDSEQQKTFLDFTYTFLPGSKLAKQIAGQGTPKTNFAGFFQPDAAATLTFAAQSDPETIKENIEQMRATMATMRKQAEKAIDEEEDIPDDETRAAVKAALSDFMDAFEATMETGHFDGGAALHLGANKLTLVAASAIKEPSKFESGLKKLAAIAEKEPDFNGVQWNAATHEGVTFHTLAVPVPADEAEARQMFGEKVDVAIGIGADAVYVAVGNDNLEAVKKAIDASKAELGKEVPPFEFSASLGQIMEMLAANPHAGDQKMFEELAKMLKDDAQGRDHVRASGTLVENGLKYRFEAEEGVLRAIGKATMMAQQKAQQQMMQAQ
ncbi:MAG: hypothetical protein AB7U97_27775, partial [Pirellulales bacterium]